VVAAAGNTGRRGVLYPAAQPGVLAVGATDASGRRTFYSSYGPELALAAPGGDTRADDDGDGLPDGVYQNTFPPGQVEVVDHFMMLMGTSMACPHVAGAAAAVLEILDAGGVAREDQAELARRALTESARTPPDGADSEMYGAGLLDVPAALERAAERAAGR
jgi:serine protease